MPKVLSQRLPPLNELLAIWRPVLGGKVNRNLLAGVRFVAMATLSGIAISGSAQVVWKVSSMGDGPRPHASLSWSAGGDQLFASNGSTVNGWDASSSEFLDVGSGRGRYYGVPGTDQFFVQSGTKISRYDFSSDSTLWSSVDKETVGPWAITRDGSLLARCSDTGVYVHLGSNGMRRHFFGVPRVQGISFSRDGKRLSLATADRTYLFDMTNGARLATWAFAFSSDVHRCALTNDGSRLVVSRMGDWKVYDATTGQVLHTFQTEPRAIGMDFSPGGDQLATLDSQGNLRTWNSASWLLDSDTKIRGSGGVVAYSPDGSRIAVRTSDHRIAIHDSITGTLQRTLCEVGTMALPCIVFTGSENLIFPFRQADPAGGFEVVSFANGQKVGGTKNLGAASGTGVARDQSVLATVAYLNGINAQIVLSTLDGTLLRKDLCPTDALNGVPMISPSGEFYGFNAGTAFHSRRISDGSTVNTLQFGVTAWCSDSSTVITLPWGGIERRRVSDGSVVWSKPWEGNRYWGGFNRELSLMVVSSDTDFEIINAETGATLKSFPLTERVENVAWRPDGQKLAYFRRGVIYELDTTTGAEILLHRPRGGFPGNLVYASDSKILAYVQDGTTNRFGIRSH